MFYKTHGVFKNLLKKVKMKFIKAFVMCLVLLSCTIVNSLNILIGKVSGTKSHNVLFNGIVNSLLEQNHTVSIISLLCKLHNTWLL